MEVVATINGPSKPLPNFAVLKSSHSDPKCKSANTYERLDPKNIHKNLENICRLQPDLAEELLSSVDTPLKTARCEESGKNYLCCDYNRDGDSYRSPWSNTFYPKLDDEEDAPHPSAHLRELETFANKSFDIYRELYYEGGISSVYFWDSEDDDVDASGKIGFAGVVLLKKTVDSNNPKDGGSWDSIHVIEIIPGSGDKATYKVTSTVILDISNSDSLDIYLSGNLTRQTSKELEYKDSASHVSNVGSLVEDIESRLRNLLQEVYFGKTKDILGDIRSLEPLNSKSDEKQKHSELIDNLKGL
ncbi:hypothetical protein OGAPHI_003937 [Ogataea philodendri]|uniref:F-actin-capping protein subunit beta n=1 Tax=Ogataea philodendri TaxID=1378263 RepID=A0A9P8T4Z2_9ASCO|nr:uncharacterized protein OGAPHI_003937 [Ogataea philodendri]KAH3665749.1 hypothetical protein OGAPHI_003937 [Ogataea philodendri]